MTLWRRALPLAVLFSSACAAGTPGTADGGGGGMDTGPSPADTGPVVRVDSGPVVREDAGPIVEEDAGSVVTDGMTCSECATSEDCEAGSYCASLSSGSSACLPSCNIDLPDCPARFDCVMNFNEVALPEPVCAPVGERCCVDPDGDLHGTGVGCLGADCDEADDSVHGSGTEACNGTDDDCDGTVDEGDPNALCPRGAHVAASVCNDLGYCENSTCEVGYGDCDEDPANGCETQTNTEMHCGGCGVVCAPENATADCSGGTCRVGVCSPGFGDCNMDPSDGCETALDTLTDCGACGRPCEPASGTGDCSSGTCQIASCNPRRADCDAMVSNGCETNTATSSDCGGCGVVCSPRNGTGECSTGSCVITSCRSDYDDCDGMVENGCERSLRTTTDCGGCDVMCSLPGGSASCATGRCELTGCSPGLADCDSVPGCEQPTNTNAHCGGCNMPCAPAHGTGSCGTGTCRVTSCDPGWGNCDGNDANGCEQSLTTLSHCGGCNTPCSRTRATATCGTGTCQIQSCDSGYGNCDGSQSNGCEQRLDTLTHCGACNSSCSRSNATATCGGGSCGIQSCNSGYDNCDGNSSNGCELRHANSPNSCSTATYVGTYDGDRSCGFSCGSNTGWDLFSTRSGNTSAWYRARVREDSTCSATIEHQIRLTSPPGTDYDLFVYRGCGTLVGQSRLGAGSQDIVTVSQSDNSGPDDDFDYWVEVRYFSGRSCSNWTLQFYGHDC